MKMSPAIKAYLAGLGLVGLVLVVLAVVLGWGFWGYFGGGFLLLAGPGSLIANHFKVGWQPAVGPCPACGESLHFVTKRQYVRCARCEALLTVEGTSLAQVDGHTVSDTPEYPVPFVIDATFPSLCMLCGQPPSQSEAIRFDKVQQKLGIPGIGPSLVEVTKLVVQVPVCAAHGGQRAVALDYGDHSSTQHQGVSLKFRSLEALEAYRQHNASVLPALRNEAQMLHAPEA